MPSLALVRDDEEQDDQPLPPTSDLDLTVPNRGSTINNRTEASAMEPDNRLFPPLNSPRKLGKRKGIHSIDMINHSLLTQRACDRPVSTWAFSQEVRQILEPGAPRELANWSNDDTQVSYIASLQGKTQFDPSTLNLPPKEHIVHLAGVVDFHLNANYCVFNHQAFEEQLSSVSTQDLLTATGIWRVKLFLVVALGKLFLEKGATDLGPPGIREFLQGVHTLPSNIVLCEDPLMATETLCLLTIYAQAADMHIMAYLYVSTCSEHLLYIY